MHKLISALSSYVRLARPYNALLPAMAIIAGFIATHPHITFGLPMSILMTVLVYLLLHSAITAWNDIRDEDVDELNGIHRIAALKESGQLVIVRACVVVSILIAVLLLLLLPLQVSDILALMVVLGWLYNDKPFLASRRPFASIVILALSYGFIPFMAGTQFQHLSWKIFLLAVGWTAVRTSLSLLKDYKDAPGDAKAGKKTFLLSFGHTRVSQVQLILAAYGYAFIIAMVFSLSGKLSVIAPLTAIALWLLFERFKLFNLTDYSSMNNLFHTLLNYEIIFDALAIVWLHSS